MPRSAAFTDPPCRTSGAVPAPVPDGVPDDGWGRWLKGQIESGSFSPVIDRTYPLEQIVEAYRYVETGQTIGNVVITV